MIATSALHLTWGRNPGGVRGHGGSVCACGRFHAVTFGPLSCSGLRAVARPSTTKRDWEDRVESLAADGESGRSFGHGCDVTTCPTIPRGGQPPTRLSRNHLLAEAEGGEGGQRVVLMAVTLRYKIVKNLNQTENQKTGLVLTGL